MEDVADGCYTEVRNASPHKHIHGREFPISFKFGHIIHPSNQSLSSIMYRAMILHRHSYLDQEKVLTSVSICERKWFMDTIEEWEIVGLIWPCIFQVEGWRVQWEQDFFFTLGQQHNRRKWKMKMMWHLKVVMTMRMIYYILAHITVKITSHVLCFSSTKALTNWRLWNS